VATLHVCDGCGKHSVPDYVFENYIWGRMDDPQWALDLCPECIQKATEAIKVALWNGN
jgi:hypothetical protein